jgi:histidinol-phosphatase (PHP family)
MVCIDGGYHDFEAGVQKHFDGSIRLMAERFFEASMQMVETGGFDIVGHIDKIYQNGSLHPDFDMQSDWYQKPFLKLLDLVAEKGRIVEINCKNMSQKAHTFPHTASFKELKKRNIPVMVNTDCHSPERVGDGLKEAFFLLKEAGYSATRELVGGQWENVGIV